MLHWIVLLIDTSLVELFTVPLLFSLQGVQTLTREDRDIMDGSTFFVVLIPHRALDKQK